MKQNVEILTVRNMVQIKMNFDDDGRLVIGKGVQLCHAYLLSVLKYDKETGLFTWLIANSNRIKIGQIAGSLLPSGYIQINLNGVKYYAHRLAWFYVKGEWPKIDIDHEDLNKSNNKWKNLREVTKSQNQHNRTHQRNNVLEMKGVRLKRGRYVAEIWLNNKPKFLGSFRTPEEAKTAYNNAALELHGWYSRK